MDNQDDFAGEINSVLLVDELKENAIQLEKCLAEYKIQLITAENQEEALALLSLTQPDIILINESLPTPQRKLLIKSLQHHSKASHIPVVLLTTHWSADANNADESHLDRLIKPINNQALTDLLKKYTQLFACRKIVSALHNHQDPLIEIKNEGLLALDHLGKIVCANNSAARLLGFKTLDLQGVYIESLLEGQHPDLNSKWLDHPIAKICATKKILQMDKSFFFQATGVQLPVKFAAIPIFDEPLISIVIAFQSRQPAVSSFIEIRDDNEPGKKHRVKQAPADEQINYSTDSSETLEVLTDDALQASSLDTSSFDQPTMTTFHDSKQLLPLDSLYDDILPIELALNDYLNKIVNSDLAIRAPVIFLLRINHWQHLIDSLSKENETRITQVVNSILQQRLTEIVSVDYLENGNFVLLANTPICHSSIDQLASRIKTLLAQPFAWDEHTLFLSSLIGASVLKGQSTPQVIVKIRQALLMAQEKNSRSGVGVMLPSLLNEDNSAPPKVNNHKNIPERDLMVDALRDAPKAKTNAAPAVINTKVDFAATQHQWYQQSPEIQLRPFFDLQNYMVKGLNVAPLYKHPSLGWQELDALCVHYRRHPSFIEIAQSLIEMFMLRLAVELRGQDLPASCQICLKIPPALLGIANFYTGFIQSLSEAGIHGSSLWIELTESAWRTSDPSFLANIKALHLYGIGLVVSEFGQSLAPLALLDKLPISAIKLARKITDKPELYRDKPWFRALRALTKSTPIKLWTTEFTKPSREALISEMGIILTDGPVFEFSSSGLSVAEFYALTQEVCSNTDVVD